ncbi:DAGAT-domain-containing protein [Aaosphaeria arxii CBS 175.79]|uniref:Diacylglycerol O-acyltransferase n=1 Tax=Aaosphaeria arxii CBS 175.79 TaxID=1450172 RepID=A0A6A5XS81_9PLEO|nr:DAGAT-domain-containing protein [Aaosphaeria arxii CBS 175.79]KAF2015756.1 DAGAT-domain-containing protein [Aaosphaeria arxii CBS 175.79]
MSLNPEPSAPEDRDAQSLPPKSYAEAAEEAIPNGSHPIGVYNSREQKLKNVENIQRNGKITIPSGDEKDQYEGEGLDSSPKSPTRGHKRTSSRKSNGSIGRKQGENISSTEVYEKFQDGNGRALTSAKPPAEYEKDARQDDGPSLTTGREAGAGWHKSKIRWAPFNVPVKRRLQTLAVLMHTLSIAGLLAFFFFLCSIPLLWPILVPYLIYALMSNAGVSGELYFRSERCRRLPVWSLFASYFPMRLHRTQELEPTRKYIFGYHPHGIISHGAFAAFATEALGFGQLFPGITNTLLTLDSNFRLPLYREYALRMGLASVSRESIQNILSRGGTNGEGMGRAVTIVVGGAREALEARPGHLRLVLKRRKGFVKLAIQSGADLVPVVAFGENDMYDQFDLTKRPLFKKLQMIVKTVFGFTAPLFHARGIFNYDVGLMPYRTPINIVVGKPILVKQESHPDQATIDELHAQYVAELQKLWDNWKDTFATERVEEMKFIE